MWIPKNSGERSFFPAAICGISRRGLCGAGCRGCLLLLEGFLGRLDIELVVGCPSVKGGILLISDLPGLFPGLRCRDAGWRGGHVFVKFLENAVQGLLLGEGFGSGIVKGSGHNGSCGNWYIEVRTSRGCGICRLGGISRGCSSRCRSASRRVCSTSKRRRCCCIGSA